jgi:membrane protein YqaA with SNARE-associated domain
VPLRIAVLVLFTAGHVLGKALWYWLGTLGSRVTQRHLRDWIERARELAARYPGIGLGVTASSAFASVPPFHLMAVAAGVVRTPPVAFFAVAFAGRLLRFGLLAAFPSLLRYLYSIS